MSFPSRKEVIPIIPTSHECISNPNGQLSIVKIVMVYEKVQITLFWKNQTGTGRMPVIQSRRVTVL